MKISYAWLKQFINIDKTPEEISIALTNTGLEVESLEKIESVPGGLEGLLIGFVLEREKHPDADRLSVTKVDLGTGEPVQIVCGAPNVAAGQKVIVAPVGSTVYPSEGEPFKIKKSKIRGEVSEGMICAEDEIGLGKSHDGILVLPPDAPVGKLAKEYFDITGDYVFEIGLTPNRADAASHLGVARDLAAVFDKPMIPLKQITLQTPGISPVKVQVDNTEACPRYSGIVLTNVQVADSPEWIKNYLQAIGIKPVNNVVDVTNYICHGLGQPMHAFDAARIKGNKVVVRNAHEAEKIVTLDGIERKLKNTDLLICDEQDALCIAGVFGGQSSGVSQDTKSVFLESAYFNSVSVRKTGKHLGLKTDASFRYERGTDPEMTITALNYAVLLLQEIAGAEIASDVIDHYPSPVQKAVVSLAYKQADRLIGKVIEPARIKQILTGLGLIILKEDANGLELQVPTAKVDVTRECDVIEEILRIYGLNQVEMPSQLRSSLSFSNKPDEDKVKDKISEMLSSLGFNEMMSNSLTSSEYYPNEEARLVNIKNPLSNDLNVLRLDLLYPGLEAISYNSNRKNKDLRLYEFGTTYEKDGGQYKESAHLALFLCGKKNAEHWSAKSTDTDLYQLKSFAELILKRLGINDLSIQPVQKEHLAEGLGYFKGKDTYLVLGKLDSRLLKKMDIDGDVFYADIFWDQLNRRLAKQKKEYTGVPKFPSVKRDLSMLLDKAVTFEQLKQIAYQSERSLLKEVNVFDVYEGDKLPGGKKSYALSFILQDEDKTLTDKEIESVMDKLIGNFEQQAGAEIRKG